MSCRRTNNNWPAIIKKRRIFLEAVKRAVEVQDLKAPKRVKAYVINHIDGVATAPFRTEATETIEVTDPTSRISGSVSDSLDGYITVDEWTWFSVTEGNN